MNVFTLVMVNLWRHYIQGYKMLIGIEFCIIFFTKFPAIQTRFGLQIFITNTFWIITLNFRYFIFSIGSIFVSNCF